MCPPERKPEHDNLIDHFLEREKKGNLPDIATHEKKTGGNGKYFEMNC